MAAPFTPTVRAEAAFGYGPFADQLTWVDLTPFNVADVDIVRGRESELDEFSSASLSLRLLDASRDLDPTNLSGTYVETITETEFPVIADAVTEIGTSLGTNNAQTLPSGVIAGDLLLAFVAVDNPGATTTVTGTGSAVWATLWSTLSGSSEIRQTVFARIATGSDALVLTGASQDYVCSIGRVVRHGCTTTGDVFISTSATGTGLADPPSHSPAGGSQKYLWLAVAAIDFTTGEAITDTPSGYTDYVMTKSANSTSSVGLGIGWIQEETGTKNAGTFTNSNPGPVWLARSIAIPPLETSEDVSEVVADTPIRVVATLASREEVLNDPCTGPDLHTAWRLTEGSIAPLSGTLVFGGGAVIYGPVYNFDGDSIFQFGVPDDGSSPELAVEIQINNDGRLGFQLAASTLTWFVDDGDTEVSDTATWNDTNHRYLRIRIDDDDVIFERSANGSAWTTLDTIVRGSDVSATTDWSAGRLRLESGNGNVTLDDFLVEVSQFTRFRGFVDSWDYQLLGGNGGAVVEVQATDAFKLLANLSITPEWDQAMEATAPDAWYPLSERPGSIQAFDRSGNGLHGTYPNPLENPAMELGADPVSPFLGGASVRMPPRSIDPGISLPVIARRTVVPFTLNCWVKAPQRFPESDSGDVTNIFGFEEFLIYSQGDEGGSSDFHFSFYIDRVDVDGEIWRWDAYFNYGDASSSSEREVTGLRLEDTLPHMLTIVNANATGDCVFYYDGIELEVSGLGDSGRLYYGTHIGMTNDPTDDLENAEQVAFPGMIDEFAMWDRALTADEVLALYEAGSAPWDGDTTGERINRVLDLIGWPASLRDIDPGEITLGPITYDNGSVLDYLRTVAATEGGNLFVGLHGEICFNDSVNVVTRDTAPPTFADHINRPAEPNLEVNILGDGFRLMSDDRKLFTSAEVTRDGGVPQRYTNDVAAARYGIRTVSQSGLLMRLDSEAEARAISLVERYKRPQTRIEQFTVAPEKKPTTWALILNLRLDDTMRVDFTALDTGDAYGEYLDTSVLSETISGGAWTFTLKGTPEDPGIDLLFQFDASADVGFDYGLWR